MEQRIMQIERKIERRIEVTADEVYAALAAKYDLNTDPGYAHFDNDDGTQRNQITLVSVSRYETQEVAENGK
jgi:hypothetical protein